MDIADDRTEEHLELSVNEEEKDDSNEVKVPAVLDGSFVEMEDATNQCAICQKSFSNKYNLQRHLRVHSDTIRCSKCGTAHDTDEQLREHISEAHGSRHYICEDCGFEYGTKQSLLRHRIIKHNLEHSEKRVCPYASCGRVFAEQHKLEHHINKHINVKPFKCGKCGEKSFSSRFVKNRHERLCGVGKLPACICGVCSKSFSTKQSLHIHKQSEHDMKSYICSCGKSFKYITGLYKHKKEKKH